ncbi:hypothetical protein [Geodermatophilus sabuli]|nr:hypothetical protein [Geodermatophilus sabuli]MBB3084456.1 hypothetical protein [Geodermatophilus sabuli]
MTAAVSSRCSRATASRHTGVRVVAGVLGLAAVVPGLGLFAFEPAAAAAPAAS